ncbi:TetR/AcrR family transcriptional regulator [Citricoccus sp. GCM10030269]|uniref:TetR/AcrR family transcriptional regulator n=1 Tax=Citricoccus sp. GCM10030269 TaxID=3273388 RepID=UPI00360C3F81
MITRAESAAATRRALMDVAETLLDQGGSAAVTMREVGDGAGVSRSASYRHFPDKESLLLAVAARAWDSLAAEIEEIAADSALDLERAVRSSLTALLTIARTRPHLYRLMYAPAPGDTGQVSTAALRAQAAFLAVLRNGLGEPAEKLTGLLTAAAHGVADLEIAGHLPPDKWNADGDALLDLLVRLALRSEVHEVQEPFSNGS